MSPIVNSSLNAKSEAKKIASDRVGAGENVLLISGFLQTRRSWSRIIPLLSKSWFEPRSFVFSRSMPPRSMPPNQASCAVGMTKGQARHGSDAPAQRAMEPRPKFFNDFSRARTRACAQGSVHPGSRTS